MDQVGKQETRRVTNQYPDAPPPREATCREKIVELLGYLSQLADSQMQIREKLFGPFPCQSGDNAKLAHEPSLNERIHTACQLAAQLAGESATIESRL